MLLDQHKDKPEVIQRFVEEAQIGGQLQHPGIAPIYELGQFADKRPFFAMKLVKGETFSKLLSDRTDPAVDRGKFIGIKALPGTRTEGTSARCECAGRATDACHARCSALPLLFPKRRAHHTDGARSGLRDRPWVEIHSNLRRSLCDQGQEPMSHPNPRSLSVSTHPISDAIRVEH